jgi:predicted transcriptional regulator
MQLPTIEEYLTDLKARLAASNITYTEVGVKMNVHASGISRWLTGKVEPRLSTMHEIEKAVAAILAEAGGARMTPPPAKRKKYVYAGVDIDPAR